MNIKNTAKLEEKVAKEFENKHALIMSVKREINSLVFGQEKVIEQIIITLLSGGHALIVGLPGLAKTRIVNFLGIIFGLQTKRVQFTPDLMPSDILGSEVLDENLKGDNVFKFVKGPVFSQLLLADEINRASPRTQSALLQSMQEKRVTYAGNNYDLPRPFHVLATQNPIEQEGTYPLPEAQLDRFFMKINISYPNLEAEKKLLILSTDDLEKEPENIISAKDLILLQEFIKTMPIGDNIFKYILNIINNSRPNSSNIKAIKENILWGPSPRASLALLSACRAKAFLDKSYSPSLFDVKSLIKPILSHRINLNISAKAENISIDELLEELMEKVDV